MFFNRMYTCWKMPASPCCEFVNYKNKLKTVEEVKLLEASEMKGDMHPIQCSINDGRGQEKPIVSPRTAEVTLFR